MKEFLKNIEIPIFMRDKRIVASTLTIVILALIGSIVGFLINPFYGIAMFLLFVLLAISLGFASYIITQNAADFASNLSYRIKRGEQEALIKMPIGIMLVDPETKKIQWVNPYLQLYLDNQDVIGKRIQQVDPELAQIITDIKSGKTANDQVVKWGSRQFEMNVQEKLGVVYLLDVTRYALIEQKYQAERIALGQIFLDNYDELSQSADDQTISHINSFVTRSLNEWAIKYNMYLKRIDDDHYLILAHARDLNTVEHEKFNILNTIRTETSTQNYPITLSMGFAFGEPDLNSLAREAQKNLDLALGRGGDQVVVKEPDKKARFYGGSSNPMEKRTRVRARMVSQAVQELFKEADQVFVMGHKFPDLDAIGSAMGIAKIAKMNGKEAHVVLDKNNVNYDVKRLLEKIEQSKQDDENLFMDEAKVMEKLTEHTLLIMVDHSKPSMTYSLPIYEALKDRVVIIDHHRRGEEFPENPILVYIEPYASSTSELVTEMLEYQPKGQASLTKLEASAMLAGIFVDTKAFSLRAGTRTFDAASYLRSIGADNTIVQSLLKEDVNSFIQRNHLISTMEMVEPGIAILKGEEDKIYDPIVAAQAVDTSLSLNGIEAAFVITRRDAETVGISARSLGTINVQVVMERLGGGGHLSNAAAQLKDVTIDEARGRLIQALSDNSDEE